MALIGYLVSKAYLVLGTRICWKSPNLNHFDILEPYDKDKGKILIGNSYSVGTRYSFASKI